MSRFTPVSLDFQRENFHYLKDNDYFFYPYVFVSPFVTGMSSQRKNFGDVQLIIADSGGYQIRMQRLKKVNLLSVLNWQEDIADIGFTVDVPPIAGSDFDKCLMQSVGNADFMAGNKIGAMKQYAVLQGRDIDELNKWHKQIIKNYEFDGFALPIRMDSSHREKTLLDSLEFAKSLQNDFHFLGNTAPVFMMIYSRLAYITGMNLTFDSSVASNALRFGEYYHHRDFIKVNIKTLNKLPCNCPVCSKHLPEHLVRNPYLAYLHNVYIFQDFNQELDIIVQDEEQFARRLEGLLKNSMFFKNYKELKKKLLKILQ